MGENSRISRLFNDEHTTAEKMVVAANSKEAEPNQDSVVCALPSHQVNDMDENRCYITRIRQSQTTFHLLSHQTWGYHKFYTSLAYVINPFIV